MPHGNEAKIQAVGMITAGTNYHHKEFPVFSYLEIKSDSSFKRYDLAKKKVVVLHTGVTGYNCMACHTQVARVVKCFGC